MQLILSLWKHHYLNLYLSKIFYCALLNRPVLFSVKAAVPACHIILLPLAWTAFS